MAGCWVVWFQWQRVIRIYLISIGKEVIDYCKSVSIFLILFVWQPFIVIFISIWKQNMQKYFVWMLFQWFLSKIVETIFNVILKRIFISNHWTWFWDVLAQNFWAASVICLGLVDAFQVRMIDTVLYNINYVLIFRQVL